MLAAAICLTAGRADTMSWEVWRTVRVVYLLFWSHSCTVFYAIDEEGTARAMSGYR